MNFEYQNLPVYKDYLEWMCKARPNDRFVYHKGASIHDSMVGKYMGQYVMKESMKGKVYLVAKKIRHCEYHFMAIRASDTPNEKLRTLNLSLAQ